MKRDLEAYWRGLLEGKAEEASLRYAEARRRARTYGFDSVETTDLAQRATAERLEKLEKLILEKLEKLEKLISTGSGRGRRLPKIKK